jgi:hypothetical protein
MTLLKGEPMKYKGIELEEVTEPQIFNPPKPMLVWDADEGCPVELNVCAIVNREGNRVITERTDWKHCAEIPEVLVTYRELSRWLAEGNGEMKFSKDSNCCSFFCYSSIDEDIPVNSNWNVRKWSDTEWHKPTREYLGLEAK